MATGRNSLDKGSIYVVSSMSGLVKIGMSVRPVERFKALCSSSPTPLRLAYVCDVTGRCSILEAEIHKRMAAVREHGEWFRCSASEAIKIVNEVSAPWAEKQLEIDPVIAEWRKRNAVRIDAGKAQARLFPKRNSKRSKPVKSTPFSKRQQTLDI